MVYQQRLAAELSESSVQRRPFRHLHYDRDLLLTVRVTDSLTPVGLTTTKALSLTVSALAITTGTPLPMGTLESSYSFTLAASGGNQPYTWSLATGPSLPAGLSISPTGTISGTPTASGSFTFRIQVTDATQPVALSVTQTFQ